LLLVRGDMRKLLVGGLGGVRGESHDLEKRTSKGKEHEKAGEKVKPSKGKKKLKEDRNKHVPSFTVKLLPPNAAAKIQSPQPSNPDAPLGLGQMP